MALLSQLLQQHHAYWRALENAPRLVSVMVLVISGVAVLLDSPLLPQTGSNLRRMSRSHCGWSIGCARLCGAARWW
jgi:hypothetical protein